jgi:hypothetical protein
MLRQRKSERGYTADMEGYMIIFLVVAFVIIAFALGIRDALNAKKYLITKLKKNFGNPPAREYKSDDLDHVDGFFKNHQEEGQIDDVTWNDLGMDGVFKRLNYCLSAAGEEYLYYLLRSPRQADEFESFEEQVSFIKENDDDRLKIQTIFWEIGHNSRYSIYDYIDYLENVSNVSNTMHFVMIVLMLTAIGFSFVNFAVGFIALAILMVIQILSYFRIKSDIDPYLVTYGYVMRVIKSIDKFSAIKASVFADDIRELEGISKEFASFRVGSSILLSANSKVHSSGNPLDILFDYLKMVTHIDLIKFNQMYKQLMEKRDRLDKILEITGRIETEVSVACFRASFENGYSIPEFTGDSYVGKDLIHPLIDGAVANTIEAKSGVLLTGSNASGKSTFLKTCAINTILAQSVHTVLGTEYRAPFYRIYSSMALKDDISMGESYYIVEIKSIKRIVDKSKTSGNRVLCFVDEVLRGTNTVERIAASTQILKSLAENGVQCFAATHDIELTSLLKDIYEIYHFEGDVTDNDVKFDYKLKAGPATTRNAIMLLKVLGYDENIVENAQKMADGFLKNGVWE